MPYMKTRNLLYPTLLNLRNLNLINTNILCSVEANSFHGPRHNGNMSIVRIVAPVFTLEHEGHIIVNILPRHAGNKLWAL